MISVVIPVYNEQDSLVALHQQLDAIARREGYELDIVLVDDGSTDDSWQRIAQLCQMDSRVRGIRFRRNFGKAAALSAGVEAARGELIVTMDADLQDDPAEIPKFLEKIDSGLDVVSGWKRVRYDPWHKVWPSRVFNGMVSRLTGVRLHDHNCGFKCYRRQVFQEVRLYGELHRFIPVLAAARGWRVGEVEIAHRPRRHGHSKYGWSRIPKGFVDLLTVKFLTGFGQRPQHALGMLGLIGFLVGGINMVYLTVAWFVSRMVPGMKVVHLHQTAIFYYSLAGVILGAQFMSVGFLAEMLLALHARDSDTYSVAERTGGEAAWRCCEMPARRSPAAHPEPSDPPAPVSSPEDR